MDKKDRRIVLLALGRFIALNVATGVVMFATAGTILWAPGWVIVALSFGYLVLLLTVGTKRFPEVLRARARTKFTHVWDKASVLVATLAIVCALALGGLSHRFSWGHVPAWLSAIGGLLVAGEYAPAFWVIATNRSAIGSSRLQPERAQVPVDRGPYSVVRHPMYSSIVLYSVGLPLLLGSLWCYIPAAVVAAGYAFRTAREDRMLCAGLTGYKDYASRVRYRLIPFVW